MSVAAIAISAAVPGADTASKTGRQKGFDSVMAGFDHARDAEAPRHDDADTRVAAKDDRDDDKDRKRDKDGRVKDAGEDPVALLALAGSVAAIARADDAATATVDKAAAETAVSLAPANAAAGEAPAQSAPPAPAQTAPDTTALSAALAAATSQQAQQPDAKSAKPATQKTMIAADTASTADVLSARATKVAPVTAGEGGKDSADADSGDSGGAASPDPRFATLTTAFAPASIAATAITPTGGEVLATGASDRQLDLAKGDAWLDSLSRDIAKSADSSGTLRFQLSPPALGNLQVELSRGDEGTAVRMTTATVDAQAILADARPRLIESARAHGVHISDATIDLGGAGTATSNNQNRDPSGDGSASSQQRGTSTSTGSGGNTNGQAQSRAQSEPDLYHSARRSSGIASASTGGSRRDLDAGYA